MEFKDYYKILGVSRDASQDEIKRAYRKLARKYHPDVSEEADAEQRFKEVGEAYEVLKDPEKRKAYDQLGSGYREGQDFRPPPGWEQDFDFGGGGFTDAEGFSDFFESIFGRGGGRAGGGFRRGNVHMKGEDKVARIQISLEDAFHGATRGITLPQHEVDEQGRVITRHKTLNVHIPKGITEGRWIRLAGQGGPGMGGARAGDLYLEVTFRPHPTFQAEGRDIFVTLPITPWEAALGAKVKVPTLGGPVDLQIPAGSDSGRKLRLKGRGLPGDPRGDQYVELRVVVPKPENDRQKELYRELAEQTSTNPRKAIGF